MDVSHLNEKISTRHESNEKLIQRDLNPTKVSPESYETWIRREYKFCIEYMLQTIRGVCVSWIYMLILDISCQHLGDECKLEGFCVPEKMYIFKYIYLYIFTIWGVCVSWIYMLVLDISCQHLGDECKLEGFCVPFGHRVGECTFLKMYICIGYMLPTIWGVCVSWIYILVLDISCQHLGDECKLEGFCVPFGHRVGECTISEMFICIGNMLPTIWGVCIS